MNIFALSMDVKQAAIWHVDKHVRKMHMEACTMLSTAHFLNGGQCRYMPSHIKHPCTIWARETIQNYRWLASLAMELCKEYSFRFGRRHSVEIHIDWLLKNEPPLPDKGLTPFALAMDDMFKLPDPIQAYRNYYKKGKRHLHTWTHRGKPLWC